MKIVALIGSCREKSNTFFLTEEILKNISSEDIHIEYDIYSLKNYSIDYCIGCVQCIGKGECILEDDFLFIKNKILEADIIMIATPVYLNWITGSLKNILDRFMIWAHTMRLAGKKIIIVTTSSHNNPHYATEYLKYTFSVFGATIIGDYHMYVDYPRELYQEDIRKRYLAQNIKDIIIKCKDKRVEKNNFQESYFHDLKKYYALYKEKMDRRVVYWYKNRLFEYSSFNELANDVLNEKKNLVD